MAARGGSSALPTHGMPSREDFLKLSERQREQINEAVSRNHTLSHLHRYTQLQTDSLLTVRSLRHRQRQPTRVQRVPLRTACSRLRPAQAGNLPIPGAVRDRAQRVGQ
jgi:ribosomal protein S13